MKSEKNFVQNIKKTKAMIESIAEASGEERGDVFMDIIIHMIFNGSFQPHLKVHVAQMKINEIAEVYKISVPILNSDVEDDFPF
jgi:hypothetical protein